MEDSKKVFDAISQTYCTAADMSENTGRNSDTYDRIYIHYKNGWDSAERYYLEREEKLIADFRETLNGIEGELKKMEKLFRTVMEIENGTNKGQH